MQQFLIVTCLGLVLGCGADDKSDADTASLTDTTNQGTTGTTTGSTTSGGTTTGTGTTSTTSQTTSTSTTSTTSTTTLPLGPNDAIAQAGCDLFLYGNSDNLTALTSHLDAGQVLIQPNPGLGHVVTLPATGDGFLSLAVGDWDTTQAFFTLLDNELTPWVPDGMQAGPLTLNGACPNDGITDQRVYFEHWTDVILIYSDLGPRDPWLGVIQVSP